MGFVYCECAFVENLVHPKALSSERTPLGQIHTQLREIISEMELGAGWAGWTQCPSHWKMPGFKYKEHSWVW